MDDTKLFEHPLLDDLAVDLSREYVKMLGRMNASLAGVLKRAHGSLDKSHGLYVIPGGLTGAVTNDLLKAAKATAVKGPKGPKKAKQSEAEKKRKKAEGSATPGIRGGKWWRDKHNHVRYGKKPDEDDEGTRDWAPMKDEDIKKLHESLEVVYGYSPYIKKEVDKALMAKGINPALLIQVFRDANSLATPVDVLWVDLAKEAGIGEDQAKEALDQILGTYKELLQTDDFRKKARDAVSFRKHDEERAVQQVVRSSKYTEEKMNQVFSGNPKDEAVRLLALMADMELLHIPTTLKEAKESEVETEIAKKARENILPNKQRLSALYSRLDEANGAQLVAIYVAQMFRDMRESGQGFGEAGSAEEYLKPGGTYDAGWLPQGSQAGASEIERMNELLNEQLDARYFDEEPTDEEAAKAAARLRELAHEIYNYIEAYNGNQGGQELGLIFTGQVQPKDLWKDNDALHALSQRVEEHRQVCAKAVEAQGNVDFATPESMKVGFAAMTKRLIAEGRLQPGQEADLVDYQRQAINWMETMKRGILAYDTGLGKTPMSIAYVAYLKTLVAAGKLAKEDARGIMVMPKGLTNQWPNEIRDFFPDAKIVEIGSAITNQEDRIRMLKAVQDGTLDADFVILSSSVVDFHDDTNKAIEDSGKFERNKQGELVAKEGVDHVSTLREFAAGDPMCSALRALRGCVFFDEASHDQQGLRKSTNMHNVAAREFLKDRERSFLLTATPMPNGDPAELFEQMDLINPGSAGPSVQKFTNRMATEAWNPATGKMELVGRDDWGQLARDIAPYVFRKSKQDEDVIAADKKAGMVLPEIEGLDHEKGGSTIGLAMPASWGRLWESAGDIRPHDWDETHPDEEFKPGSGTRAEGLKRMHQQQMMSVSPRLIIGDDPAEWAKYGYDGSQPKLEHLAQEIKAHFQQPKNHDSPMVVFSNYPGAFKLAIDLLTDPNGPHKMDRSLFGEFHGGVPQDKRNAYTEACNAGKIKVMFVGIGAGGAGLNLQKKAWKMRFLDQPWKPGDKQQCLGRVWRKGQTRTVEVGNYYMKGTFDTKKVLSLQGKSATDVAASSAHLDEEFLAQRAMNQTLQILGGPDADKFEQMSDADIAARIEAQGLTGILTPDNLKHVDGKPKFDLEPFKNSVAYKTKLKFGQQGFQSQRMLAHVKYKAGDMTKEEYERAKDKLNQQEHEWVRQNKLLGNMKVAVSSDVPIEPEQEYSLTQAKGAKLNELSDTAKAVLQAMKASGGKLTVTDFVDQHLKENIEKEVEKDKDGKPVDSFAHAASVQKWWANRKDIHKEVENAFKELDNKGIVNTKAGSRKPALPVDDEEEEAPKAPRAKRDAAPPPERSSPEAITAAAAEPKVNFVGGWTWKVKTGDHLKTKEFKSVMSPIAGIKLKELVDVLAEERKLPKTMDQFVETIGCTPLQAKKLIAMFHKYGVMS